MSELYRKRTVRVQDRVLNLVHEPSFYLILGANIALFRYIWNQAPGYLTPAAAAKLQPFMVQLGTTCLNTAIVGALFNAGYYASASIRSKNDLWNTTVGGATVGVFAGLRNVTPGRGRFHSVVISAMGLGTVATVLMYMGRLPIDYEEKTIEEELERKYAYFKFENTRKEAPIRTTGNYPKKYDYQGKN